jgi:hypothetical protein
VLIFRINVLPVFSPSKILVEIIPETSIRARDNKDDGVLTEGLLAPPPQPRTKEEHMEMHCDVVEKSFDIIAGIRTMSIYSLWWIEQHLKDYNKRYNNDYKPEKAYVKFVQTAAKKAKVPVVQCTSI